MAAVLQLLLCLTSMPFFRRVQSWVRSHHHRLIHERSLHFESQSRLFAGRQRLAHPRQNEIASQLPKLRPSAASKPRFIDEHDSGYWEEQLSRVDKPSARALVKFVDSRIVLGIRMENATSRGLRKLRTPALYREFVQWKRERPRHVLLVRVGEFYESQGIDAIMLVQYAGLNPMGNPSNPPRAGCPKQNIQRTLDDLTNNGLSVAVYEERRSSSSARRKTRYLAQVVTPGFPNYLVGRIEEASADTYNIPQPILAMAYGVSGVLVIKALADERRIVVMEGLAEDGVDLVFKSCLVSQVWLHRPPGGDFAKGSFEADWENKIRKTIRVSHGVLDIKTYVAQEPVTGFISHLKRDLGLDSQDPFKIMRDYHPVELFSKTTSSASRIRTAVVDSTAQNLGLYPTRGIHPLASAVLPQHSSVLCKAFVDDLLLSPPPRDIAMNINHATNIMLRLPTTESVPIQYPIPIGKIHSLLIAQEASDSFFREIYQMLDGIKQVITASNAKLGTKKWKIDVSSALVPLVRFTTGLHNITLKSMEEDCQKISGLIDQIIHDANSALTCAGDEYSSLEEVDRDSEAGFSGEIAEVEAMIRNAEAP